MFANKKSYAFDFDSNLVFTQDTIFLLKNSWWSWNKVEISQQEFDEIQIDNKNWRRLNDNPIDSLVNFRKPGNYKKALLDALDNNMKWPARWSFVEANESASPIAIITARGQSPNELEISHKLLIYKFFSTKERWSLVENMQKNLNVELDEKQAIELYLKNNLYLPVESQEFLDMSGTNLEMPTKIRKHVSLQIFVKHVQNLFSIYNWKEFIENPEFSMWFSDDNLQNSKSMVDFIKSNLSLKYPKVKFSVYDTNDFKNVKKIKI